MTQDEYNFSLVDDPEKNTFIKKCAALRLKSSLFNISYCICDNYPNLKVTMTIANEKKVLMVYESSYTNYYTNYFPIKVNLQGVTAEEEEMYLTLLKLELS